MAEFEFQESEIIFSVSDQDHHNYFTCQRNSRKKKTAAKAATAAAARKMASSVPVSIPAGKICRYVEGEENEEGEMDYDDGEMTPPHLIVGRRIAGKMAFSVCTGNGRTLKGRDLSQVRNSILRMTGFLET